MNHFNYFLQFFKDDRYIKIDGKPLLIIYFPDILQRLDEMIDCWCKMAVESGFPGIEILYQKAVSHFNNGLNKDCFDGGIEFQPGYSLEKNKSSKTRIKQKIIFNIVNFAKMRLNINFLRRVQSKEIHRSYDDLWKDILETRPDNEKMYPGAFVDWDNTPRKGVRGSLYDGASPEKFESYLKQQIVNARDNYQKDMLFMFAWNEWAEGGYLEPDEKNEYKYLQAIKNALDSTGEFPEY